MSWIDELRPASFRGVQFYVHASDMKGGRTIVTHEVPGSERRPFKEDMGSAGRTHAVEAYVYGDGYQADLRRLLDALDQAGPGQLNHPFTGVALCVVDGEFSVRQSGDEGGFAVITVTFAEVTAAMPAPAVVASGSSAAVLAQVARVKTAVSLTFASASQSLLADGITGVHFFAAGELTGLVGENLERALAAVAVPGELLARFQRQLAAPKVQPEDFVSDPTGFFPALIYSLFAGMAESLTDPASLVAQPVEVLLSFATENLVPNEADEETQAVAPSLTLLVQRGALCAACEVLVVQRFDSYEGAIVGRQSVIDAINRHFAAAADDTYADFVDLRGAIARAVPGADSALPRLQQYTPPATVPSLVLAHRLYGDVDTEADVVARNHIPNPAFVTGGRALEVLGRG